MNAQEFYICRKHTLEMLNKTKEKFEELLALPFHSQQEFYDACDLYLSDCFLDLKSNGYPCTWQWFKKEITITDADDVVFDFAVRCYINGDYIMDAPFFVAGTVYSKKPNQTTSLSDTLLKQIVNAVTDNILANYDLKITLVKKNT